MRAESVAWLLVAAHAAFLGSLFLGGHSWGAAGDDSPAYIEMAGRAARGEPLVYRDPVVARLEEAGLPQEAQAATPHFHYERLGDGVVAPRTQVGTSVLMGAMAAFGEEAPFLLHPLLGALGILVLHAAGSALLRGLPGGPWISALATIAATATGRYRLMATYQPMTELVAFVFLAAAFWLALARDLRPVPRYALAALLAGAAVAARTTSLLAGPPLLLLAAVDAWKASAPPGRWQATLRSLGATAAAAAPAFLVGYVPALAVVAAVGRETGSLRLLPNQDHLEGLSADSLAGNAGKFDPGVGGLEHYWSALDASYGFPGLVALFALGWAALAVARPAGAAALGAFCAGNYALFSFWTNPYVRYIQPVTPFVAFLAVAGLLVGWARVPKPGLRVAGAALLLLVSASFVGAVAAGGAWTPPDPSTAPDRGLPRSDWQAMGAFDLPEGSVVMAVGTAREFAATLAGISGERVVKAPDATLNATRLDREAEVLRGAGLEVYVLVRANGLDTLRRSFGERLESPAATLELTLGSFHASRLAPAA